MGRFVEHKRSRSDRAGTVTIQGVPPLDNVTAVATSQAMPDLVRSGMSRLRANVFVVCCASSVLACSADKASESKAADAASPPTAAADASAAQDAGKPPDHTEAGVGNADDAFIPPPNSSFESARALTPGEDTMQRVVNEAQVDYYSFEARAGTFYVLSTNVSRFAPNNVITVFDPEQTMIAENDDGSLYPNGSIDARVIIRPEHSGTYYVTAEDRVLEAEAADGHFIPPLFYTMSLREIDPSTPGYTLEMDDQSPTSLMLVEDAVAHARYITVLGDLSDDDKSDTYEIHGMPDNALIGQLLAAGKTGDGSSAEAVTVRVTADSDGHLLARGGLTSGQSAQTNIHPPVDDASYRIQISAGEGVGSNGFYALDLVLLADNPHERTEPDNNNIGSAELITLTGAASRRGLLLSRLPADDVDYYRFDAQAGELAAVHCEGESGGSGVRALQAELFAPNMMSLAKARETSTKPLAIMPTKLDAGGSYSLKLSSETPAVPADAKDAVEPWVRCSVVVGH